MTLTRRLLLKLFAALGVILTPRVLLAEPTEKTEQDSDVVSLKALGPFVDTLLPEDSTPSATQLGVDRALVEQARTDPNLAIFIVAGCGWLDRVAREQGVDEFADLDETARAAIVSAAEQSPKDNLEGGFFGLIRHYAFMHYYAQPASWHGLGFSGPPQHRGFPDHAESPRTPAS